MGSSPLFGSSCLLALTALGCAVDTESSPALAQAESTYALVAITRSTPARAPGESRADALATFLRVPADANAQKAMSTAGLSLELPNTGECRRVTPGQAAVGADLARVDLLDAGEVTVAAGGSVTTLAPRAFPTITDSIAGVVYTTRDRAPEPLPTSLDYTVATSGVGAFGPVSAVARAPEALSAVSVLGTPLAEVSVLSTLRDLELTWAPGSAGDRVYVTVDAGAVVAQCAFMDQAGHGTLPVAVVPAAGPATLSVHRLRETRFADVGLAGGELRFDFELEASVTIE